MELIAMFCAGFTAYDAVLYRRWQGWHSIGITAAVVFWLPNIMNSARWM